MSNVDVSSAQMDPFGIGFRSGRDSLHELFLGPLPQLNRVDNYQERNADIWTMPENYKGRNLYLRDTIEDWMFTADPSYMTTRVLPWYPTEDVTIQWSQFEANAHLMGLTPYLTPSTTVTQKHKFMKAKLVRRGIRAQFEVDFLKTPMGRSSFLAALGQMTRSVQETAHAEGLRQLINAHRTQEQLIRSLNLPEDRIIAENMQKDVERFAIVQKQKNGLEQLDMMISSEMERYRGVADCYLIPEAVSIYATIVRPEKTDYYLAGQEGPNRVNKIGGIQPAGGGRALPRVEATHMVRGNDGYIVKALHVDGLDRDQEDMMTRVRQIGNYYTMLHEEVGDYKDYQSSHRSILIYDEDIDDMTRIDLITALENCQVFDDAAGGRVRSLPYNDMSKFDAQQDFLTTLDENNRLQQVNIIGEIHPDFLGPQFLKNVLTTLKEKPVNSLVPAANRGINSEVPQEIPRTANYERAVQQMMASGVPETHQDQINAIFAGEGSLVDKAALARDAIKGMVKNKVPGLRFKDEAPVDMLYERTMMEYKRKMEEQSTRRASGLESIGQFDWETAPTDPVDRTRSQRAQQAAALGASNNRIRRHLDMLQSYGISTGEEGRLRSYLQIPMTKDNMRKLINMDILPPMNFLLFQPHAQYATKAIVKCKQDGGCGYTFIGNGNLMIGNESIRKMVDMHYTVHMRSVITQPKNVYVQPDVMVVRAEGGAGSRFYTPETYKNYDPSRLANSLIAVAIPPAERRFPAAMDLSGRNVTEYNIKLTSGQRSRALHYSSAGRYTHMYNFLGNENGESQVPHMGPGRLHKNRTCYQGHQQNYNPGTKNWDRVVVNKGHWGKNVYPGCKPVRQGALDMLEQQNYSVSSVRG